MRIVKYNPSLLSEDTLRENFVVRHTDLDLIIGTIRENTTDSNQHILVIGPRGSGKTTLVLRTAAELKGDKELNDRWYPLIFSEESYEVVSAGEFWLEALFHLGEQTGDPTWKQTYAELKKESDNDRLSARALGQLLDFADSRQKRILLIVENLNMLFSDLISQDEAWKIRHTLINEPRLMLLASATSRFENFENASQAMFEMFKMHELVPLNDDECNAIWELITGRKLQGQKIRPIRILTGGNPRLLTIIATFGAGRSFGKLLDDLVDLIDDHTEYFKSHLDNLPAIERKVYLALAELWDLSTAREIAAAARLDVNKTSSLLSRLVGRGAVAFKMKGKRTKLYVIAERMYNIYYLMRRRGKPADRVKAAVKFMVSMYDPESAARMIAEEACNLAPEHCNDHYLAFAEVLKEVRDPQGQKKILSSIPRNFFDSPHIDDSIKNLMVCEKQSETHENVSKVTKVELKKVQRILAKAIKLFKDGDHEKSINMFDNYTKEVGGTKEPILVEVVATAYSCKGFLLSLLGRLEEAIGVYEEVVARFGDNKEPDLVKEVEFALVNKGVCLGILGKLHQAEESFRGAIQADPNSSRAYAGLINLFLQNHEKHLYALQLAEETITRRPDDAQLLNAIARVFYENNISSLLQKSETWARQAVSILPDDLRFHHTLACILSTLGKGDEALESTKKYIADADFVEESLDDAIGLFVELASSGYAKEALELLRDSPAAKHLEPLIIGLQLSIGEEVKTAVEIFEVAKDVVTRIEDRRKKREDQTSCPPANQ